jgi:hypothetical protein
MITRVGPLLVANSNDDKRSNVTIILTVKCLDDLSSSLLMKKPIVVSLSNTIVCNPMRTMANKKAIVSDITIVWFKLSLRKVNASQIMI